MLVLLLLMVSYTAMAEGNDEDSLDIELSELEEGDFPDLVGVDEEGGIMDEFAFLQEEDIVYTAAKW
jgi:hypothetical protein